MNEMVRNFTDDAYDITDVRGTDMCLEILEHMRGKMRHYQEETGNLYNLEATPAEGTTYRFAREDKKRYSRHSSSWLRGKYLLHKLIANSSRPHR
jgi:anaerobic ribonucleoside-triphosphate reductase